MKKMAVVLAGCGFKDGAEITESVSTLISISEKGVYYECFAPDLEIEAKDNITGTKLGQKRNVLNEAARRSRKRCHHRRSNSPPTRMQHCNSRRVLTGLVHTTSINMAMMTANTAPATCDPDQRGCHTTAADTGAASDAVDEDGTYVCLLCTWTASVLELVWEDEADASNSAMVGCFPCASFAV